MLFVPRGKLLPTISLPKLNLPPLFRRGITLPEDVSPPQCTSSFVVARCKPCYLFKTTSAKNSYFSPSRELLPSLNISGGRSSFSHPREKVSVVLFTKVVSFSYFDFLLRFAVLPLFYQRPPSCCAAHTAFVCQP